MGSVSVQREERLAPELREWPKRGRHTSGHDDELGDTTVESLREFEDMLEHCTLQARRFVTNSLALDSKC